MILTHAQFFFFLQQQLDRRLQDVFDWSITPVASSAAFEFSVIYMRRRNSA